MTTKTNNNFKHLGIWPAAALQKINLTKKIKPLSMFALICFLFNLSCSCLTGWKVQKQVLYKSKIVLQILVQCSRGQGQKFLNILCNKGDILHAGNLIVIFQQKP